MLWWNLERRAQLSAHPYVFVQQPLFTLGPLPCAGGTVFGDTTERLGRAGSHVGFPSGDMNFVTMVQALPTRLIFSTCHAGTLLQPKT